MQQLRVKIDEAVQRRMSRKIEKVLLEIASSERKIYERKKRDIGIENN